MIEIGNILDAERHLSGIEVVIFDLDDTLYSEKDYVKSGYKKISELFGIPEMADKMWSVFVRGGKAIDEVLSLYGLEKFKDEALKEYRFHQPHISLYADVFEMLERLRRDKKIGIITDGRPEGQRAKLTALGLNADKVIITDELGGIEYRKPNAKAFCIMREFFDVPFEKMAYIGDNPKKDFIAPEMLGMKSIWFKNPDGLYSE